MVAVADKEQLSNKEELISQAVAHLRHFTKLYGIHSLFIAGGYCRSVYLNRLWETNDIDVASAYEEQSLQLGGLFASEVLKTTPKFYERTGTAMVDFTSEFGSIKIEFQGNSCSAYMYNQEIRDWFHDNEIENVPLMNNVYGRDFTINSLLYSLHTDQLLDPTNRAARDFDRKLIVSLLPPEMLVKHNPLAILRAIRFALTYEFYIDSDLRSAMKKHVSELPKAVTQERIVKEVVRILKIDAKEGIKMLNKFGLSKILLDDELRQYVYLGGKDE